VRFGARVVVVVGVALLAGTGLGVGRASACNSGWDRDPNDGVHYWAGAQSSGTSYQVNGIQSILSTTNPTVPDPGQYVGAWIGMWTYDNAGNTVLVQDGLLKQEGTGGVVTTFYQINVGPSGYVAWAGTPQNLTPGDNNNYEVYYQGGHAYFDFNGSQKGAIDITDLNPPLNGITDLTPWYPLANGEVSSFAQQMPGTLNNQETWSTIELRRWAGSGTAWDSSMNQNWVTTGFPQGASGGVSQSSVNGAFKNTVADYYGYPVIQAYDTCSSS